MIMTLCSISQAEKSRMSFRSMRSKWKKQKTKHTQINFSTIFLMKTEYLIYYIYYICKHTQRRTTRRETWAKNSSLDKSNLFASPNQLQNTLVMQYFSTHCLGNLFFQMEGRWQVSVSWCVIIYLPFSPVQTIYCSFKVMD